MDGEERAQARRGSARARPRGRAPRRWRGCCAGAATACRRTRRRGRAQAIPTAMCSFATSTRRSAAAIAAGEPVISIDTKKKELVGDFKNGGRELRPKGSPIAVRTHDFIDKRARQGDPLRRLRHRRRQRLRQRRDRPTTPPSSRSPRSAPGGSNSGSERYPDANDADDHRRLRRLQRQPHPPVEDRAATPRRPRPASRSASATSRPAPRSGTRSSTASSASSATTGAASRSSAFEVIINLIGATTTRTGLEVYARLDERAYPQESRSPTPNSPPSTSNRHTSSTPNGTTPSRPRPPTPTHRIERLRALRPPQRRCRAPRQGASVRCVSAEWRNWCSVHPPDATENSSSARR